MVILFVLFLVSALQGCVGKKVVETEPVFFPPPPNPPRIQFLTGLNSSEDMEGKKQSFALFVLAGEEAEQVKLIGKPYGIKTHKGKIYVCDIGRSNIVIIDPAKKTFEYLKGNVSLGKLKKPVNLALDDQGRLYVADVVRKEIVVYNPEGHFAASYGKQLNMKPADVEVDDKYLYILDVAGNEIKVLDRSNGNYLRSIGKKTGESEGVSLPTNMTLGPDGFLYVTNVGTGKVLKLDRDGHVLSSFGGMGDAFGQFARPKGIDVDEKGRIYVVDGGHQNVQLFSPEARLLIFFGDPGLNPEFTRGVMNLPTDVAVTRDNLEFFRKFADPSFTVESLIFVANQYGVDKISVYGLGHSKNQGVDAN
jgi:DNA-binding beta-propeller fold protein YncE